MTQYRFRVDLNTGEVSELPVHETDVENFTHDELSNLAQELSKGRQALTYDKIAKRVTQLRELLHDEDNELYGSLERLHLLKLLDVFAFHAL